MLKKEAVPPEKLAYDRPSSKLMGFLRKHFNLSRHVPQNNNFVVFSAYFEGSSRSAASSSYASAPRGHSYAAPVTVNKVGCYFTLRILLPVSDFKSQAQVEKSTRFLSQCRANLLGLSRNLQCLLLPFQRFRLMKCLRRQK